MDQDEESRYGFWPLVHEYPDPDYAAHVTQYPWVGEVDESVQSQLRDSRNGAWKGGFESSSESDQPVALNEHLGEYPDEYNGLPVVNERVDPDYLMSDDAVPEDEIVTDEDSADSIEGLRDFRDHVESHLPLSSADRRESSGRQPNTRGAGRRGRRGGLGRGGKGIKRGPRKAIEPTEEFKALHSQATIAFIDQKYEEAEQLTLQAILINPEMYPAHNLLSQIHTARGDEDKAISAAWTGAHTKHRDPEIWSRTASLILNKKSDDRASILRGAIYCINRIINLDKHNVEARCQRATLYHEIGHKGKAALEYEELFKQLPYDTTVLRHLAEIYIELEKPERALVHYLSSIVHFQILEPYEVSSFAWSDVNIVTELYGFQERYEEGIKQLKSLSRWLLGRGKDTYWEAFDKDDREWDFEDHPRRTELSEFIPGEHDATSYGDGLPLELRVKLGVFRLRAQRQDLEEAINHFEWLDPEDNQTGAKLYDYADLFREAADALRRLNFFHEALRYYEPLKQVSGNVDASYLSELASCYRAIGFRAEAEACYNQIIDGDTGNYEARMQLAELHQEFKLTQPGYTGGLQAATRKPYQSRSRMVNRDTKCTKVVTPLQPSAIPKLLAPLPVPHATKKLAMDREQLEEDGVRSLFHHRQSLADKLRKGEKDCKNELMAATKSLLNNFRNNKIFYPVDKHHRFYGYSKEARMMSSRPKHELDAMVERSESIFETPSGDRVTVPTSYCDIPFETWLDIFLEYGLMIALEGDLGSAYETIDSAYHANVFFHSSESLFLIHVCWFTCALNGNDDETLCNVARWFIKEYQFVTDGYRLFSSLNKLCDSENPWYNCGPSQKYILRQLKAVDFSLLGDTHQKGQTQGRASYTTKDSEGLKIQATDMDIVLLMLYGHILHAGRSYSYAVNYYLRALALDPGNPMIKLSLALGYIHYALKRQAENRHQILMQGLAFLLEYYDDRSHSNSLLEQQEAEYNVGHTYHLLGLTHLAVPYYERCLDLCQGVQTEPSNCRAENYALEAAINLQCFWAASGNIAKARAMTEEWMVLW